MSTLRTSAADQNYISISNGIVQLYAGTDHPEQQMSVPFPPVFLPENPLQYAAILKVADSTSDLALVSLQVSQGMENAIDCNNRACRLHFEGEIGVGGGVGDQVITTKGGCHDLSYAGTVHSRGRLYDICVGNWSDQSFDPSYNLSYAGLKHIDGKPLRFVFGRVRNPIRALFGKSKDIKLPPDAKVLFWYSLGTMTYWLCKRALVKIGILK